MADATRPRSLPSMLAVRLIYRRMFSRSYSPGRVLRCTRATSRSKDLVARGLLDRDHPDFLRRIEAGRRDLHLHLVAVARGRSAQKFRTTYRLEEVADRSARDISWTVTWLRPARSRSIMTSTVGKSCACPNWRSRTAGTFSNSARTFRAYARSSRRFGPWITISTGVGEPKLMTSLTMSAGSNEKRRACRRRETSSEASPSLRHFASSQRRAAPAIRGGAGT